MAYLAFEQWLTGSELSACYQTLCTLVSFIKPDTFTQAVIFQKLFIAILFIGLGGQRAQFNADMTMKLPNGTYRRYSIKMDNSVDFKHIPQIMEVIKLWQSDLQELHGEQLALEKSKSIYLFTCAKLYYFW
jgi:hypothetical protein